MMRGVGAVALVVVVGAFGPVWAQNAATTCAKMRDEDRLGPFSFAQCQCNYSVAEQVLDDDIRALLFDAWHTGRDNVARVEQLKPRARVRRQFNAMAQAIDKYCK